MGLFKKILSSISGNSYEEEEMETEVINSNSEISEIATEEETAAKNKALIGVLQFLKRRLEEQETAKKILEEAYAKQTAKETSEAKQMAAEAERKLAEAERKLADTQRKLAKAERKLADTKRKLELAQRLAEEKTAKQTAEETLADKEIEEEGPTIIDKNYIDELIKNGIKEVILPASVEEIRTDCWDDFVSIDMSKCHKLTKIGEEKFAECKSLERIDLPDSITTIGEQAFYGCESLKSIRLPKNLTSIGDGAFYGCKYLSGSLLIPEGVTEIRRGAFNGCVGLNGILSLPSTLKKLGNRGKDDMGDEGTDYYGGVFQGCRNLTGNLTLPDNLELIRGYCFNECGGLYGELRLPAKLKRLGNCAFSGCIGLTGSLTIPQGVTALPSEAFHNCGFNGILTLHDGISNIANDAFADCHFKGELHLPKSLKVISNNAFCNNDFSGVLTLPSTLTHIGSSAFANNWRLMGVLDIPDEVESVGESAFANCRMLEGIIFPESMETIRQGAFNECFGITSIRCKGTMPARIESGAFDGIAKDNFTLEVPESAVSQYQAAPGWCDFKRIAAHHELVCRPSVACALSTEHKQNLVINAEGEWEVASKPDWCDVSPASGNKKTEVTLTIKGMAKNAGSRNGKVVFRLKDKEYTHECNVSQYGYQYGENEWLTLQKATKGNNGGINIVLLGDGFNAKDIASGEYLKTIKQEVEYFFGIEPYKTYRNYFNVYTAFPLSTESGVGTVNTIRYNRFNTTFTGGVGLKADYDEVFDYSLGAPTVNKGNLNQTLIIIVPNSTDYGGICQMWESGAAIAFCPLSTYGYPLDTRGVVQHEAGGHGFGKLGDEYIYHNAFIDFCDCTCCGHVNELNGAKSLGWFDNLELTGKMHSVGWSHLIFDDRYSDIVDIYEGGYMHNRGVFRSEANSCMNNDIPYYSTISRESIVKRIKRYAGEPYSFEEFVKNDKRDAGTVTRSIDVNDKRTAHTYQHAPKIHKGNPLKMPKVRRHRR